MSPKNLEIDRVAAMWAAMRDLRSLTPREEEEFSAWLAASPLHLGAYGRAEAVLARLERLNPNSALTLVGKGNSIQRRTVLFGTAAAASLAIVAGTVISGLTQSEKKSVSTAVGQIKRIILDDGSVVLMNTDTSIHIAYTAAERRIFLEKGEAIFEVAKNRARPFIVTAGDAEIKAVGTSFSVLRLPSRAIEVLVQEGVVELQRQLGSSEIPVRAGRNIKAILVKDAPILTTSIPQKTLTQDLEWRKGRIVFENQTLERAAVEYSRYSNVRISIDPSASQRTVTGLFSSNDPVGFARTAAGLLNLQVEVHRDEVRIYDVTATKP